MLYNNVFVTNILCIQKKFSIHLVDNSSEKLSFHRLVTKNKTKYIIYIISFLIMKIILLCELHVESCDVMMRCHWNNVVLFEVICVYWLHNWCFNFGERIFLNILQYSCKPWLNPSLSTVGIIQLLFPLNGFVLCYYNFDYINHTSNK